VAALAGRQAGVLRPAKNVQLDAVPQTETLSLSLSLSLRLSERLQARDDRTRPRGPSRSRAPAAPPQRRKASMPSSTKEDLYGSASTKEDLYGSASTKEDLYGSASTKEALGRHRAPRPIPQGRPQAAWKAGFAAWAYGQAHSLSSLPVRASLPPFRPPSPSESVTSDTVHWPFRVGHVPCSYRVGHVPAGGLFPRPACCVGPRAWSALSTRLGSFPSS
jgi:hypothetical protein